MNRVFSLCGGGGHWDRIWNRFLGNWRAKSRHSFALIEMDSCTDQLFVREIGQKQIHLIPRQQEMRSLPIQLRSVYTKHRAFRPLEDDLLLFNNSCL